MTFLIWNCCHTNSSSFISYDLKYLLQLDYSVEHVNGDPVYSTPILCPCGQTIILDYLLEGALIFAPILFSLSFERSFFSMSEVVVDWDSQCVSL